MIFSIRDKAQDRIDPACAADNTNLQGTPADIAELGRNLQVGWLLRGSVRKDDARLRITVQLIEVKSRAHVWSEDYDREVKDVFAIQSDVARRVAQAVKVGNRRGGIR